MYQCKEADGSYAVSSDFSLHRHFQRYCHVRKERESGFKRLVCCMYAVHSSIAVLKLDDIERAVEEGITFAR